MDTIKLIVQTYGLTVGFAIFACIAVGGLTEMFKVSVFSKQEVKYKDQPEKLADIKTVKGIVAFVFGAVLTAVCLSLIYADPELPNIGGIAVLPVHFAIMLFGELLVDLGAIKNILKRFAEKKLLGETEVKEKKKKMKKVVTWTEVED